MQMKGVFLVLFVLVSVKLSVAFIDDFIEAGLASSPCAAKLLKCKEALYGEILQEYFGIVGKESLPRVSLKEACEDGDGSFTENFSGVKCIRSTLLSPVCSAIVSDKIKDVIKDLLSLDRLKEAQKFQCKHVKKFKGLYECAATNLIQLNGCLAQLVADFIPHFAEIRFKEAVQKQMLTTLFCTYVGRALNCIAMLRCAQHSDVEALRTVLQTSLPEACGQHLTASPGRQEL